MSEGHPESATQPAPSALTRDLAVLRGEGPAPGGRPRPRRIGLWIAAALLLGAAGLFAWRQLARPVEVELAAVTWRDVGAPPALLSASGYLEARRQITLSSKAQGRIVEMPVRESQRVEAGELVARLESDEARASLALARAELADAERELVRLEQLSARKAVAEAQLDRARTQREVARARRDLAQVAFDHHEIRAPIDGTVIRKIRDVGEFLTIGVTADGDPGTAVATLADLSALDVALEVGETEIAKVRLGGVALVTPEAAPRRRYLADVVEIAAMADRQKGTVPVKVRIREPDAALLPDMSAVVAFLAGEPEGTIEVRRAVPASAVVDRDGRQVVFAAEDGRARALPVSGRATGDGAFALAEGPEEGTPVVASPPPELRDGAALRLPEG